MKCLVDEGADTIFGYPGGQIMPVYDKLVDYSDKLRHLEKQEWCWSLPAREQRTSSQA